MSQSATTLETADIAAILKALPHRYPFLMVDRIIEMRGDDAAVGIKNVTVNEPQFLGHFPGNPVFPGVLLIEGMAQTAGAICVLSQMGGDHPKHVYFMTIDKAKFRKPVVPGEHVVVSGRCEGRRSDGRRGRSRRHGCVRWAWRQSIQPPGSNRGR